MNLEIVLGVAILVLLTTIIYLTYPAKKFKVFYDNIKNNKVTYYWVENDYPVKIRDFQILKDYSQMRTSDSNIRHIRSDVFKWFRKNSHKILSELEAKKKYPEWLI